MTKSILVTGASRGIGKASALALAEEGRTIWIHYHQFRTGAQETARLCQEKGAKTHLVSADLGNPREIQTMFSEIAKTSAGLDILVNNAGISTYGLFQEASVEDWRAISSVNLDGAIHCTRLALPHMLSEKWGRIINISSIWGLVGASYESLYATTKAALLGLTKSLAKELAYSGITVNAIAPGLVATDMMEELSPEDLAYTLQEVPLGRLIQPEEIALWVRHFADDQASAVTGQVLNISGGFVLS